MTQLQEEIQHLVKKYHTDPCKRMGQHFLVDAEVRDEIVEAAEIQPHERVLEVGPGPGILTQSLLRATAHVTAVEADRRFEDLLKKFNAMHPDFEYVMRDIMQVNIPALMKDKPYLVVSNLPYNITSAFLRMMLTNPHPPVRMVVMIQKEVAERIVAKPGDMSLLSLMAQLYSDVTWVREVSRDSFWPQPNVDSAVIRLDQQDTPRVPEPEKVMQYARMGFAGKRKQLHNTLSAGLHWSPEDVRDALTRIGILSSARPQELSIEQWARVAEVFS